MEINYNNNTFLELFLLEEIFIKKFNNNKQIPTYIQNIKAISCFIFMKLIKQSKAC